MLEQNDLSAIAGFDEIETGSFEGTHEHPVREVYELAQSGADEQVPCPEVRQTSPQAILHLGQRCRKHSITPRPDRTLATFGSRDLPHYTASGLAERCDGTARAERKARAAKLEADI